MGPRDLTEFSLPAPQRHPWPAVPAFHVALARKACTGLALSPAPRGPWVQEHSHPVHDGVLFPPPWGGKRCWSSAWRFTACAAPRPDLAAHLGLLCRCTRSIHPIAPAKPRPSGTCQLTGHKLQSVALNKRTPNAQALRPEKDFSKPHLTLPHLPADSLADDSSHTTQQVLPHENCDSPDKPLPRARLKPGSSRKKPPSTRPAQLGRESLP